MLEDILDSGLAELSDSVLIIEMMSSSGDSVVGRTGGNRSDVLMGITGIAGILSCTGGLRVVVAADAPPNDTLN